MNKIFRKAITTSLILTTSFVIATSSFAAELKPIYKDNKWGFENTAGTQVVSAKYQGVSEFKNGYAGFKKNNLWGFIDSKGKEVVPAIYTLVSDFKDGLSPAKRAGKWGMVNTTGKEVISFTYDELYYFDSDNTAYAKKNGKWGKIDKAEKTVVPFIYDQIDRMTKYNLNVSKVVLDGEEIEFDAYNINNNNYIKIRDIAKAVDGSSKQFEVSWDKENRRIDLLSGKSYTPVGGELEKSKGKGKTLRFNQSPVAKDGQTLVFQAYNIDNNNYFKLRDIAEAFNIGVNWNSKTKTVEINTNENYVKE